MQRAPAPYSTVHQAIKNIVARGILVVAGTGNDAQDLAGPDETFGTSDDAVPAALPEVMAVSGMDTSLGTNGNSIDIFYSDSNFSQIARTNDPDQRSNQLCKFPGGAIDAAAPSVNILTTGTNLARDIVRDRHQLCRAACCGIGGALHRRQWAGDKRSRRLCHSPGDHQQQPAAIAVELRTQHAGSGHESRTAGHAVGKLDTATLHHRREQSSQRIPNLFLCPAGIRLHTSVRSRPDSME